MALSFLISISPSQAQSEISADFAAIIGSNGGRTADLGYDGENVGIFGPDSFPVLVGDNNLAIVAAGRTSGESTSPVARAVIAGHYSFLDLNGGTVTSSLFENAVLWAGGQADRASTTVAVNNWYEANFFSNRGFATKIVDSWMQNSASDLSGCDVVVIDFEWVLTDNARGKVNDFVAAGGGIVGAARPWVVREDREFHDFVENLLGRFGLLYGQQGFGDQINFTVPTEELSVNYNAASALSSMSDHVADLDLLSSEEMEIALVAINSLKQSEVSVAALKPQFDSIAAQVGWIAPTEQNVIRKSEDPVQHALVVLQNTWINQLPADDLFVHPAAADTPGLPAPDASPVSKVIEIDGTTPPWDQNMMFLSLDPTWRMTGLYAAPGEKLSIQIPAHLVDAGLQVHIGATFNSNNSRDEFRTMPQLWRRMPLDAEVNEVGHALGGLLSILVPPGSNLGSFDITISGAIEAPHFDVDRHTLEDWTSRLSQHPAPWGYIKTGGVILFCPAARLREVADMQKLAEYWRDVMELGDEYYGYADLRQREEMVATNRDSVAYGSGYAGYPHELSWGAKNQAILDDALRGGDWGSLHEIGHAYQSHLNESFTFARGLDGKIDWETDVNLFPTMVYNMFHDIDSWDPRANTHFSAPNRWNDRQNWESLPESERIWALACDRKNRDYDRVGYDFFFNLSEAFGWDAYKIALSRLARWQSGQPDAELDEVQRLDPNNRRNWFYLVFCDAAQRNLDQYFQYYGLGAPGRGEEIHARAKAIIAAKNYEVWTGNRPLTALLGPESIAIPEDHKPGKEFATFHGVDPEPGTVFTYTITAGNEAGLFSIDKRSGKLKLAGGRLDFETEPQHRITIRCQDNGVPRYELSKAFDIVVEDVANEVPVDTGRMIMIPPSQGVGADLGPILKLDPAATLVEVGLSGMLEGVFSVDAAGHLILENPGAFSLGDTLEGNVYGQDSFGNLFYIPLRMVVGGGLREQRWDGQETFFDNDWSGLPSYDGLLDAATTGEHAGTDYSRRMTGWLVPPASGSYHFWIASNNDGRLLLGSGPEPASATEITSYRGWVTYQNFDAANRRSAAIELEAGRAYWFEVQQTEDIGSDHVSIAWEGPGISGRQVIAGEFLIPALPQNDPVFKLVSHPYYQWLANAGYSPDDADTGMMARIGSSSVINFMQFALGGDLNDPAKNVIHRLIRHTGEEEVEDPIALTIAVRAGAVFSGSTSLQATVGGVTYVVEASEDLTNWELPVVEIIPAYDEGGTVSAPEGYELRSFWIDSGGPTQQAGFVRVRLATAP